MTSHTLVGEYNYGLVVLSIAIAIVLAYTTLDLVGRVTASRGMVRFLWSTGSATAMGTGIWSMHYIGMLAFSLPLVVRHHWPTVLLSWAAAVCASLVACSWSAVLPGQTGPHGKNTPLSKRTGSGLLLLSCGCIYRDLDNPSSNVRFSAVNTLLEGEVD